MRFGLNHFIEKNTSSFAIIPIFPVTFAWPLGNKPREIKKENRNNMPFRNYIIIVACLVLRASRPGARRGVAPVPSGVLQRGELFRLRGRRF